MEQIVFDGFVFSEHTPGELLLYEYKGCADVVKIPARVKDKPVTVIGTSAFCFSGMEKVIIPDSIKKIENSAFNGCKELKEIKIPDSVTEIDSQAFFSCTGLEKVVMPRTITQVHTETFCNCKSLKEVKIPDTVKNIHYRAFFGCKSLVAVEIPSSVRSIGIDGFENCNSLENISIKACEGDIDIGPYAFPQTAKIDFDKNNKEKGSLLNIA